MAKALTRWQLGDSVVDPTETLLRLISQTSQRVNLYASLLERQYDEAGGEVGPDMPVGDDDEREDPDEPPKQRAVPGPRIPHWVAGLIGLKYSAAGKDGYIYASDEGIRALVSLEQSERRLLTEQCKAAISAGLAERTVKLAEQQGAMLVAAVRLMVEMAVAQGVPAEHAAVLLQVAPQALRQIEGQPA